MPYVSERQRRWAYTPTGVRALGGPEKVAEWDRASKGKKLPARKLQDGGASSILNAISASGNLRPGDRFIPLSQVGMVPDWIAGSPGSTSTRNVSQGWPSDLTQVYYNTFDQYQPDQLGWVPVGGMRTNPNAAKKWGLAARAAPPVEEVPPPPLPEPEPEPPPIDYTYPTETLPQGEPPPLPLFMQSSQLPFPRMPFRLPELRASDNEEDSAGGVVPFANALRYANRFAMGGSTMVRPYMRRIGDRGLKGGLIKSQVPGRTDRIPMSVHGGSYVLPADVVSGVGENNTLAGARKLDKLFSQGPYQSGANPSLSKAAPKFMPNRSARMIRQRFAQGGAPKTDIIVAGGEYLIKRDMVEQIGGGDLERGFAILDAFVKAVRNHNVKTLKKLPPPKK